MPFLLSGTIGGINGPPTPKSLQFYGPIRVIQELLPTLVASVPQVHMDHRISIGLARESDELHVGLPGGSAAFSRITWQAGAHQVFPCGLTALAARQDMIQR